MTDEANAGGADASAEPSGAPIDTNPTPQAPEPLGSQIPEREQPKVDEPKAEGEKGKDTDKKPSVRDAINKAQEELKAKQEKAATDQPKKEAEPAKQPEKQAKEPAKIEELVQQRSADGKFQSQQPEGQPEQQKDPAPEQQAQVSDAPKRFDDQAKTEWANTPVSVRGAVHRTLGEMDKAIEKYKGDADSFNELRDFDNLAKQSNTTIKDALTKYVNTEVALGSKDPQVKLRALNEIVEKTFGTNLRDLAARIMQQKPDEAQAQQSRENVELKNEVRELKQQIANINSGLTKQNNQHIQQTLQQFAQETNPDGSLKHPRMEELDDEMAFLMSATNPDGTHRFNSLSEVYEMADRMNPAANPAPQQSAAHTGTTQPGDQTPTQPKPANPNGQKSISGAPSSGSDPQPRNSGPVPSIRDALKNATRRAS